MAYPYLKLHLYRFWLIILLLPATLLPGRLTGQQNHSPQYDHRHFTDENGLPQNSVKAIMMDKDGFIWLTTESGLVRYDGRRFVTYDQSVIPVHSNRMGSFYPTNTIPGKDDNAFFALGSPNDYLEIKEGKVSIDSAGFEKFISRIPYGREFRSGKIFIDQNLPNRFTQNIKAGICIIPDEADGSYICTPRTVAYYKGLQKQYEVNFNTPDFWSFFRLGATLFWCDNNGQFKKIETGASKDVMLTGDILQHPAWRSGTRNYELYWSNAAGQAFLYLQKKLYLITKDASGNLDTRLILAEFDCIKNNIISFYYDTKSNKIFLGSSNKGLFTFSPRQFRALSIGDDDKDNVYYGQAAWGHDQVLTAQGDVLGLGGSYVLPVIKRIANWDRYSMLIDRKGYIWIRKGDYIHKFDPEGKKIIAKWDLGSELTQLYEGKDGQIWIGSLRIGLYRIDSNDPGATPRPVLTAAKLRDISCLQQEGPDVLWVGTGKGLYRVHMHNGRIDTIKGLEQSYIRSLHIPRTGEVWVTSYGTGFFLYSGNRLTRFPVDKAGYLATAHCFVEDSLGYCWVPTNKGLFQAAKNDLLNYAAGKQEQVFYLYHASEEGFNTNEFNGGCQPCAIQLPNGYISLPSLNGLVWFNPATLKNVLPDKKIFIDRIEVDQATVQLKDTLTLSRRFKLLKLYCATPYTGNEYNIDMQYAWIKGDERPVWFSLGNDNIISQSSLVHGTNTLIIRKLNGFGKENYSYKKLTVIVPPAFYETWWFYGALLVMMIILMWMYGRLRLGYIRRRNRQLEAQVSERTEELSKTLSALSVSEQNIRRQMHVREVLFTAISHDIGSPLKYMAMMAEELKDSLETEKVPDKMKQYADDIFQSGYYLYHLTRNLLQYLRIAEENSSLKNRQIDLHQLVENKTIVFRPIAAQQSVTVINKVPEKYYLYNDPLLLEVIIHNLLDNAVKATREGNVTVRIDTMDAQTHLVIEDTGHGMRQEIVSYYNNETAPKEENIKPDGFYAGFGLNIVKELARLMGVKLQIEASAKGTAVHLIFREQILSK